MEAAAGRRLEAELQQYIYRLNVEEAIDRQKYGPEKISKSGFREEVTIRQGIRKPPLMQPAARECE